MIEVRLDASSKRKLTVANDRITLRVFSADSAEFVERLKAIGVDAATQLRPVDRTARADIRLVDGVVLLSFYQGSRKDRLRTLRYEHS